MQKNSGYADDHLLPQPFKKKAGPQLDSTAKRGPIQRRKSSKPGGKIVLNDELSLKNKSKTTVQSADHRPGHDIPHLGNSEEVLESLQTSHLSDSLQSHPGHKKQPVRDSAFSNHTESGKHCTSEAETGVRTSQTPSLESNNQQLPAKDWLTESDNTLKESVGECREVMEYVYSDDNNMGDIESYKKLSKLSRDMDLLLAESFEDSDLNDDLSRQMESLEQIKKMMEERDIQNRGMAAMAEDFKRMSYEVADMPDDYEEVVERVANQVLADRRAGMFGAQTKSSEEEELGNGSQLMKAVQDKLQSTFYGFSKTTETALTEKQRLDLEYQKGMQRIRDLDREIALKEKEEKNVKEMIKLNRKKERELEMDIRVNTPDTIIENNSGMTAQSSKSDFFPTQPKRAKGGNSKNLDRQLKDNSTTSTNGPVRRVRKLPSRPSSQQVSKPSARSSALQNSVDFIRRNIESINMTDHERFLSSLDAKSRSRYDTLLNEIEAGLDSDDPEEFRRVSRLHYDNIYNYPADLQERFREIDERIVDMMAQEETKQTAKAGSKDILRDRVEQKEAKKRISQIDETVERIRNGELDPSPEMTKEILAREMSIVDAGTLQSIKDTIDMAQFDDWQNLDEEAIEIIKGIDIDSMEQYLNTCLESIEKTEEHLKQQEEIHKITDPEALERSQKYMESYINFLGNQKSMLDEFKIHDKITSEEDFDRFEAEVRDKLTANGDKLDQWFAVLDAGKAELDRLSVEHTVLINETMTLKIRDPSTFDQEVEAEVRAKRPDLFGKVYPAIQEEDEDSDEKEATEDGTTAMDENLSKEQSMVGDI